MEADIMVAKYFQPTFSVLLHLCSVVQSC